MATLPGLVIKIGANTKDAIDGLNKVNRAMGRSATTSDRLRMSFTKMTPALGAAAIGVGALATKLSVDSARAWMDEERSLAQINTALKNLGYEQATAQVGRFIDDLQYTANVADSELRPAFSRLLRSTDSITESQRALQIALDISAATGKSLDVVANGLGKAYDGNAASLGRLGLGLDKTVLKSGNMAQITDILIDKFGGSSAASQNTLSGAVRGVSIAWDELQESFGKGLLGTGNGDSIQQLEETEKQLRLLQPAAENAGESVRNFGVGALTTLDRLSAINTALEENDFERFWQMMQAGATGNDQAFSAYVATVRDSGEAFKYQQYAAYNATNAMYDYKTAAEDTTLATDLQIASIKRLQGVLDNFGKKQSLMEQRFGLNQMLAEGPGKSGQRKGADGKVTRFTTTADRKEFAFGVASQSRQLASDLIEAGKRGQARNILQQARSTIRGLGLSDTFETGLLGTVRTPGGLRRRDPMRADTPQSGAEVAMVNYNFYGGINVDSSEAIQQAAKEAKRLASLSGDRYAGMAATGKGYRR